MDIEEDLCSKGYRIVRRFGVRRTAVVGVERAEERLVVKHASDPPTIASLESAVRFHAAVRHPVVAGLVRHERTPTSLTLFEEWAPGEVLIDGADPAVLARDDPASPYARFRGLPVEALVAAIDDLLDAHVAVAAAGFVAVDLYDGSVVYDFDRNRLALIDLDCYRPSPYVLDADRQLGSTTFMAPEELRRGATIDERTMVHVLGRMALVYLGCERQAAARREDFRGNDEQFEVGVRACRSSPADRFPSVAALAGAWALASR
jgi:hypothetical protein